MPDNSYAGFFADNPQWAYQAQRPQAGGQAQSSYWDRNYSNIYGQYSGYLGGLMQQGQAPTTSFMDYLRGYDWQKEFLGQSPRSRGMYPQYAAPSMRWNV